MSKSTGYKVIIEHSDITLVQTFRSIRDALVECRKLGYCTRIYTIHGVPCGRWTPCLGFVKAS